MKSKIALFSFLSLWLMTASGFAQQTARVVKYHANDIVSRASQDALHHADSAAPGGEDSGGCHWRQGLLDHRRRGQLLLSASGQGRHPLQSQPDHRQRQRVFVHAGRSSKSADPDLKIVIEPSEYIGHGRCQRLAEAGFSLRSRWRRRHRSQAAQSAGCASHRAVPLRLSHEGI